jgi:hypothetical protein
MKESTVVKNVEQVVFLYNEQQKMMKQMRAIAERIIQLGEQANEILYDELDKAVDDKRYFMAFSECALVEGVNPLDEEMISNQLFNSDIEFQTVPPKSTVRKIIKNAETEEDEDE